MGILEIMFSIFAIFSTVRADHNPNACPTSFCGSLSLSYPFKLQNMQPQDNCSHIDLDCNKTTDIDAAAILHLPYVGDFDVIEIEYYSQNIQLRDPDNCLMGRLKKKLNLSSSPFRAIAYENYTFYMCPSDAPVIGYYVFPIGCLSNSTNSTVATAFAPLDDMLYYGCEVIGISQLPVLGLGQFEFNGINSDLYLTWNSTTCVACEHQTDVNTGEPPKDSLWAKFAKSPLFMTSFVTLAILFVICLLQVTRSISLRYATSTDTALADIGLPVSATATAEAPPPQSTAVGLDESKINSCTELVVLSESRINPGDDSNTCSICLESYRPQDIVRSIAKCEHCFHADCIEQWLSKNRTCPVCRTILAGIDL